MKRIQFFLFISFVYLSFSGCASKMTLNSESTQKSIQDTKLVDTAKYKCTYHFKFLIDSIKMTFRDKDLYVVQIGENFTKSYCYQTFYIDSIDSTPGGVNGRLRAFEYYIQNTPKETPGYFEGMRTIMNRGFFQFYVYKDYQNEKITVTDNISGYFFIYDDELKPQDWTLLEDTTTMLDYSCQKAKCNFRGRDWEAWFAPDIPIDEGPWKFYGLPGLIMKLEDTESHYSFEMVGLQQVDESIHMTVNKYARPINRLSFLRLKMNQAGTDLVAMDLARLGISSAGSQELHYDYIERDYK